MLTLDKQWFHPVLVTPDDPPTYEDSVHQRLDILSRLNVYLDVTDVIESTHRDN